MDIGLLVALLAAGGVVYLIYKRYQETEGNKGGGRDKKDSNENFPK